MKIRTIITQDAEVDDQNSLRHFLFYTNEVDLQGIVQTSSKFHWQGIPGAKTIPDPTINADFPDSETPDAPFDAPYRWTGTAWMMHQIDDYEKDYPNLLRHSPDYPTPDYLRSITKVGNIGYRGETEKPTEGSELIRKAILDDDERTLYLQVWGGSNTIARALMDIEAEFAGQPGWEALHSRISEKIVITACGEQDECYRQYIAEQWPDILFVKALQMQSYAYAWFLNPESDSKDTLKAKFMKEEILGGKSALADGYCTWMDGVEYEGERSDSQFGSNPDIAQEWFGARFFGAIPNQYDFLSEGDSPTFFPLFDFGFRSLENFGYGGIAGRYEKVSDQFNSKGQPLNFWDVAKDSFTDREGKTHMMESMWPYVADIQRSFASRVAWAAADSYEKGEHAPSLTISEGTDLTAAVGETLALHALAASPDHAQVTVSFRIYAEASAIYAQDAVLTADGCAAELTVPVSAAPGDQLHVIVKAEADGHYRLTHYQQIIVTVK